MGEVPGGDAAGGSQALAQLIDRYGSALAWDFHRAGLDFWDWMADLLSEAPERSPGYLLALIEWLPDDGAYAACRAAEPQRGEPVKATGPHAFYGKGLAWNQRADLWDLQAAIAGGKGKPPTYPRPERNTRGGGKSLFAMAAAQRRAVAPRVAGQAKRG